jgi:hypothetical protein
MIDAETAADFGPRFEASQGVSLFILGGFAIVQYKIQSAIALAQEVQRQQSELEKLYQRQKVEGIIDVDE